MQKLYIGQVLRSAARRCPGRPAAILGDRVLTFQQVAEEAAKLAGSLLKLGVGRGDRVVWSSETSLDAVPLYFATAQIGAIFTPLNPRYTDEEARAVLRKADPAVVLTDGQRNGMLLRELPQGRLIDGMELLTVEETDPHVMFFTSGTTGEPKGCLLSHRADRLRAGYGSPWPNGPTVCMFPQFHMAGWIFCLSTWLSSDAMVYVNRSEADELLSAVTRHKGHQLYCIPAVWQRILDENLTKYDLASLRHVDTGTSSTTPEFLRSLVDAFPQAATSVVYGSTEAGRVCMLGPDDLFRKPNSVGLPYPGAEVRLDEFGEMCVRSEHLFSGYFRDVDATDNVIVDGWYRSGELAECDDEGYYCIVGRQKDVIRTGGETVAPAEVDVVLRAHPVIADAAVAGIPDDRWGEIVVAFVVPQPGRSIDIQELRDFCKSRLASHKHPRKLMLVQSIPRTAATGQVQRRMLSELGLRNATEQENPI